MVAELTSLLNDEIENVELLEFYEPDVKVRLNPKCGQRDITAEFLLYPFLNGVMTEQHYVIPLYREDISQLIEYLDNFIKRVE